MYQHKTDDMDELKDEIRQYWKRIDDDLVGNTIYSFRMRVQTMLEVDGRGFAHLLKL